MRKLYLLIPTCILTLSLTAQNVAINNTGVPSDSSAILDIQSTSKGVLVPRMMTAQRMAISTPATGLMVYDTEYDKFFCYAGGAWVELFSDYLSLLSDADADTRVDVEETPDEDMIRFTVDGIETLMLDGKTLHYESGDSNLYIGHDVGALNSASSNTAVGARAFQKSISGGYNTAFGTNALQENVLGATNTAIGALALPKSTGSSNTALGYAAYRQHEIGTNNVGIGKYSSFLQSTGSRNVVVGSNADYWNSAGDNNTIIGYAAGNGNGFHNKSGNVFLGYQAGFYETGDNKLYIANQATFPLIYGEFDSSRVRVHGTMHALNGFSDWDGDTKIQVEEGFDDDDVIRFDLAGEEQWRMTGNRIEPGNPENNVYLGKGAGMSGNSNTLENIAIGDSTLVHNTTFDNIAIGFRAMRDKISGSSNVAIGDGAMRDNTNGTRNVAIGDEVMEHSEFGDRNVAIGQEALQNNTFGDNNVAIGDEAGQFSTGDQNVYIGHETGQNATGDHKLYIANTDTDDPLIYGEFDSARIRINGAMTTTLGLSDWDGDTKIQLEENSNEDKIRFDLGGTEHFVMDGARLQVNNSGSSVFIGNGAGASDDLSGNNAVFIGQSAGNANTTGTWNTAIGRNALISNSTGSRNTAIGSVALRDNNGNKNIAMGVDAGQRNTGSNNVFLGFEAGKNNTAGSGNVFLGNEAGDAAIGSNKLYIDNTGTNSPLLYGEFDNNYIEANGWLQVSGGPGGVGGGDASLSGGGYLVTGTISSANIAIDDNEIMARNNGNASDLWLNYEGGNVVIGGPDGGKVGVGTGLFAPDGKVHIKNNGTGTAPQLVIHEDSSTDYARINFKTNADNTSRWTLAGITSSTAANERFHIYNDDVGNILTASGEGNVGIGESNPVYKMHVKGNDLILPMALIRNTHTGAFSTGLDVQLGPSTASTNRFIQFTDADGNAGEITGGIGMSVFYSTSSDARLKKNIQPLTGALSILEKMKPSTYQWRCDDAADVGFIAQELREVIPSAVSGSPDGDAGVRPMGVDYGRVTPVLTAAMQELLAEVRRLKREVEAMRAIINLSGLASHPLNLPGLASPH